MRGRIAGIALILVVAGAVAAAADLQLRQKRTLVVYTTPALQDVLEKRIFPAYTKLTGERVEPVYVAAGEQYNRLRMSGDGPEADVFLHASPLYLEQGFADGHFLPLDVPAARQINATYLGAATAGGGREWIAFAWSPLVEVYSPKFAAPPDLATSNATIGFAHPLLSNNGVYNVILFEKVDPAAGRHALAHTTVQPVNARATLNGIVDGSYEVTLGYEAVSLLYQSKGARIASALPVIHGNASIVPVLFTVGVVKDHRHPDAERFARFLFENATQALLAKSYLRPVVAGAPEPVGAVDVSHAATVDLDWGTWQGLRDKLKDYEVGK